MGQIKFITSLVMICLFTIAIITFAINFGIDNRTRINLANDSDFSTLNTDQQSRVEQFYTDSNTSSVAMYSSTISSQTEATEGGTAFKVGPTTAMAMAKNSISVAYTKIFGSDSGFGVFLTAFISLLSTIAILYIYKAWAGRNPD